MLRKRVRRKKKHKADKGERKKIQEIIRWRTGWRKRRGAERGKKERKKSKKERMRERKKEKKSFREKGVITIPVTASVAVCAVIPDFWSSGAKPFPRGS